MKRRQFIQSSITAGVGGLTAGACSSMRSGPKPHTGPGFDVHPFVKAHPEAVFIKRTGVSSKEDEQGILDEGRALADDLIVRTVSGGWSPASKVACKPNWTCNSPVDGVSTLENRGINTDKFFVEGFMREVRNKGPQELYLNECACPDQWPVHGWTQMAERNGFILRDLTSKDYWDLDEGKDLLFVKVPNGVVFKEIAFQVPVVDPGTFLVNIAKFKAHGMGITACIKNLQGVSGKRFHQFCGGSGDIFKMYEKQYHKYFQKDYMERIAELRTIHQPTIPRWDKPDDSKIGGFYMEQWCNRMLDSLSVTPMQLNIVEGIYGRDGNGFQAGPHDGKPMDFMSNNLVFGRDPFRVDIITHWLAGHEPGNFGLFHLGIERGMSNVLDPADIPVYEWRNGQATLARLDTFERTPLRTYYLQRDWDGQQEPFYHLCDEPFDYTAWKQGRKQADAKPVFRALGRDNAGRGVMELGLPDRDNVFVEIRNRHGELMWTLRGEGLEPGVHQVVWDGFASPGLYNVYVKGMGWDAARQMVIPA